MIEALKRRVAKRTDRRQQGDDEVLIAIHYKDCDDQRVVRTDYYLSNAGAETSLAEFLRATKAEHRIEECLQRAKSEAGWGNYEVRNWVGWHHHQTLTLIATWFLATAARRRKKIDSGDYAATDSRRHLADPRPSVPMRYTLAHPTHARKTAPARQTRSPVPLEAA